MHMFASNVGEIVTSRYLVSLILQAVKVLVAGCTILQATDTVIKCVHDTYHRAN